LAPHFKPAIFFSAQSCPL